MSAARITAPVSGDRPFLGPANTQRPTFVLSQHDLERDGVLYRFRFTWLPLPSTWLVNAARETGEVITDGGVTLAVGISLLRPFETRIGAPPGQLFALYSDGRGSHPQRGDLRGAVTLYYRPLVVRERVLGTDDELW